GVYLGLLSYARAADSQLLHAGLQRAPLQSEHRRSALRAADLPVGGLERIENGPALGVFECLRLSGGYRGRLSLQIAHRHAQNWSRRQNHGALDQVLQLTDIA